MKVSNILRYCINTISLIICALGTYYAFLYYKSESFYKMYEEFDARMIGVTIAAIVITEIANLLIMLIKCCRSDGNYYAKASYKCYISLFVIIAIVSFIKFNDIFGLELGMLFLDCAFFYIGDIGEFAEVREVETIFEEYK